MLLLWYNVFISNNEKQLIQSRLFHAETCSRALHKTLVRKFFSNQGVDLLFELSNILMTTELLIVLTVEQFHV